MSMVPCAVCKKPSTEADKPFCSKRCAKVDLGRWLGDGYAIPGEPLEDLPESLSESGAYPFPDRDE